MFALRASSAALASSRARQVHARPEKEFSTRKAEGVPKEAASACIRALMALHRVTRLHPTDRASGRAHDNALGRDVGSRTMHSGEHRAVRHAGRGEDHIAGRQVMQCVFSTEVRDPKTPGATSLFLVAKDKPRLDLPADAS